MAQLEKIVRPFLPSDPNQPLWETYFSEVPEAVDTVLEWTANTNVDTANNEGTAVDEAWAGSGVNAEQVFLEEVEEEYDYFEVPNPKDENQTIWEKKLTYRTITTWDVGPEWFSNSRHGRWKVKTVVEDVLNNTRVTHWDSTYYRHRDNLQFDAYNYGRPASTPTTWMA